MFVLDSTDLISSFKINFLLNKKMRMMCVSSNQQETFRDALMAVTWKILWIIFQEYWHICLVLIEYLSLMAVGAAVWEHQRIASVWRITVLIQQQWRHLFSDYLFSTLIINTQKYILENKIFAGNCTQRNCLGLQRLR